MKFSKARTLDFVSKKISLFSVPDFIYFETLSFQTDSAAIFKKIQDTFKKDIVVVRSSAASEDGDTNSAAGAYDSVLNVSVNNLSEIKAAVDVVLQSYINKGEDLRDEVIVQKMISDVSINKDILVGQHRKVNLSIEPFNIKKVYSSFYEGTEDRYISIYKISDL